MRKIFEFGKQAKVDFGKTASDYTKYRQGFPPEMFVRLQRGHGLVHAGQRMLDVGTGTGTIARQLAGHGCQVTALDPSLEMINAAKQLSQQEDAEISFVHSKIEENSLETGSFDAVFAGQCWHWFESHVAFKEVERLLKPNGKLVICHFDWLPIKGNVAHATEELVLKHNPSWALNGGTGIYPQWTIDAAECGFTDIETFSFDMDVLYTHEAWRGRMRAMSGVAASLSPSEVEQFDQQLAELLASRFPEDPLHIPHRVWAMVAQRPRA